MVTALVELDENTNRVLNMVKATYDLKDKGEAIALVVQEYVELKEEPALRPDFIEKFRKVRGQKSIRVKDFARRYGLKADVRPKDKT